METLSKELTIYETHNGNPIGRIRLNGYNIINKAATVVPGKMQSFMIVAGTLWNSWSTQTPLLLSTETGQALTVRIAAYPVDNASFGLLEYL